MRPSIIFDFDGTLAVGHGPVLAYARLLAPRANTGYLARVEAALGEHAKGDLTYRDGYHVAAAIAAADGVDAAAADTAYRQSRRQLGSENAPVSTMPGLADFLTTLRPHADLLLATNAPRDGIDTVLDGWGARDLFDELHFRVGKPQGIVEIARRALAAGPVLSVGDIAEYDLAPAAALGADTALVGATAESSPASVTMRGASLADLRTDIETWAATAAAGVSAP
ncbi:HAD family hydrolase [Myceligenerans halotolerans]